MENDVNGLGRHFGDIRVGIGLHNFSSSYLFNIRINAFHTNIVILSQLADYYYKQNAYFFFWV
jgi:hypothetical protein